MKSIEAGGLCSPIVQRRARNARTRSEESHVVLLTAACPGAAVREARVCAPPVDHQALLQAVKREFAKLALFPNHSVPWPHGRAHASRLGYPESVLDSLPDAAVASSSGAGCPLPLLQSLRPGQSVVDVGCGSGMDLLFMARAVGTAGRALGIDASAEMVAKARLAAREAGLMHARVEQGLAERLPVADSTVDLVLFNGVLNALVADNSLALAEARRVLRPAGRLVVAAASPDQVASLAVRADPKQWIENFAGALPWPLLANVLRDAGFAVVDRQMRMSGPFFPRAASILLTARCADSEVPN